MDYLDTFSNLSDDDLEKILVYINKKRGVDLLTAYRRTFIFRRMRVRMRTARICSIGEYTDKLEKDPDELSKLLETLAINVTEFFRDPDVFNLVKDKIIPEVIADKDSQKEKIIRVWSAGCAYGQEPYSLAILLNEALEGREGFYVRIIATDVDADALERAAKGEYEERDFKEMKKEFLEKYFIKAYNGMHKIKDQIRQMIVFKQHNLINDPGFRFMDLVFCRNVMIYFNREQQDLLLNKFHSSLNSKGYLVIGKTESIWSRDIFTPVSTMQKVYKKAVK